MATDAFDVAFGTVIAAAIVGGVVYGSGSLKSVFHEPQYIDDQRVGICYAKGNVVNCTKAIKEMAAQQGLVYKPDR